MTAVYLSSRRNCYFWVVRQDKDSITWTLVHFTLFRTILLCCNKLPLLCYICQQISSTILIFKNFVELMITLPGTISLLLSGSDIQLESCWLLPRFVCHYYSLSILIPCWSLVWFIGVAGQVFCLLCSLGSLRGAFWYHEKQSLRRKYVSSVPTQDPLGPVSKVNAVFSTRDLPSASGG